MSAIADRRASPLRLAIRSHRFEVRVLVVFAVVALAASLGVILELRSFHIPVECFPQDGATGCEAYAAAVIDYFGWVSWVSIAMVVLVAMTVVPSLLLGLALSAKELDRGTTAFVWSLATSRRRWFVQRVAPAAIAILAAGLAAAVVSDLLETMRVPTVDAGRSFQLLGFRGLALAGMGFAVFGLTLLGGTVVGRILPGLIVAAVLGLASVVVINLANSRLLDSEVVLIKQSAMYGGVYSSFGGGSYGGGIGEQPQRAPLPMPEPRVVDQRLLTRTGELLTYQEAFERYGGVWEVEDLGSIGPGDAPPPDQGLPPGAVPMQSMVLVNPGEIYALADARMGLLFGVVGLVSIVLAFAVIERRRP